MSDQPLSAPTYAPVQAPAIEVPNYLRLHWILALLVGGIVNSFLGGGLGTSMWLLLQAKWVKKVTGETKAYNMTIASIVVFIIVAVAGFFTKIFSTNSSTTQAGSAVGTGQAVMALVFACVVFVAVIVGVVLYLMGTFALRRELEAAPFGMKLSGTMTFFFSAIYFQYHLNKWGLPGEVGGPPVVAAPPAPLPVPPTPVPVVEASVPPAQS